MGEIKNDWMRWDAFKEWVNAEYGIAGIECLGVYPQLGNDVVGIIKFRFNGEIKTSELSLIMSIYESIEQQKARIRKHLLDPIRDKLLGEEKV
jgi:hypothetical protein